MTSDVYAQLSAQGYIVGRPHRPAGGRRRPPREAATGSGRPSRSRPRSTSAPGPRHDALPGRDWLNALTRTLRTLPARSLDYGDPRGEAELRTTLSDHLGRTRGVIADPGLIVIVQGARQGTDILIRVLARRGVRRIATEDPSQTVPRDQMEIFGIEPVGCPVDKNGVSVPADLEAAALIVTPAHQFPTGVVMSGKRRRRCLRGRGAIS